MIAIIDYGLGNLKAFFNVYKSLNIPVIIAKVSEDLENASKVIIPGVGSFDYAMERLNKSGMRQTLDEIVTHLNVPVLGVCVGMQMLARSSEEGTLQGLGWIDGEVKKFDPSTLVQSTRLPHMGWNDVRPIVKNSLFNGLEQDARFYFLHSYYFYCHKRENVIAVTDYGGEFVCAVNSGNIFGVQFHPEKSHQCGIQLLKNFALMV
jgi:glutamine amidotransferase